jgi:hypothetical protein
VEQVKSVEMSVRGFKTKSLLSCVKTPNKRQKVKREAN